MAKSDKDHAQQLLQMATMDHQAIEKALKAWIAVRGLEYPKTHDVSGLIKILKGDGADLSEFSHLEDYTPFAVQYRYELMSDDTLARDEAIEDTQEFLDHVRRIVESSP
jgi:HEPN domain-containing protein